MAAAKEATRVRVGSWRLLMVNDADGSRKSFRTSIPIPVPVRTTTDATDFSSLFSSSIFGSSNPTDSDQTKTVDRQMIVSIYDCYGIDHTNMYTRTLASDICKVRKIDRSTFKSRSSTKFGRTLLISDTLYLVRGLSLFVRFLVQKLGFGENGGFVGSVWGS
jgi:hypothetical protein